MILNFLNPSKFAHETADIKLAYFQSAVLWVNVDGFQKFKIMMVRFDLLMENYEKRHQFLLVLYDFEKLISLLLLMIQNFLVFAGKCRVDRF